jgi:hypothetical protein
MINQNVRPFGVPAEMSGGLFSEERVAPLVLRDVLLE